MFRVGRIAIGALADLVCPERCAACPALVVAMVLFCAGCRAEINVLGPPECDACGSPQSFAGRCDACRTRADPGIRVARGVAAYGDDPGSSPVARALTAFKYGRARRLGRRLAATMARRVPDPTVDVLIPMPLHPRRLRERGFNQSAVMARHLGRALGRPCTFTALHRIRDTPSQTALSLAERAANVADAFAVARADRITDRRVLLIDDVWTSGATARAAAAALRAAGAASVDVLTFARVL